MVVAIKYVPIHVEMSRCNAWSGCSNTPTTCCHQWRATAVTFYSTVQCCYTFYYSIFESARDRLLSYVAAVQSSHTKQLFANRTLKHCLSAAAKIWKSNTARKPMTYTSATLLEPYELWSGTLKTRWGKNQINCLGKEQQYHRSNATGRQVK